MLLSTFPRTKNRSILYTAHFLVLLRLFAFQKASLSHKPLVTLPHVSALPMASPVFLCIMTKGEAKGSCMLSPGSKKCELRCTWKPPQSPHLSNSQNFQKLMAICAPNKTLCSYAYIYLCSPA